MNRALDYLCSAPDFNLKFAPCYETFSLCRIYRTTCADDWFVEIESLENFIHRKTDTLLFQYIYESYYRQFFKNNNNLVFRSVCYPPTFVECGQSSLLGFGLF